MFKYVKTYCTYWFNCDIQVVAVVETVRDTNNWMTETIKAAPLTVLEKLRNELVGMPSFALEKCPQRVAPYVVPNYPRLTTLKDTVSMNLAIMFYIFYFYKKKKRKIIT